MRARAWCIFLGWIFLSGSVSFATPPAPYEYVTLAEYTGNATDSRILSLGTGDLVVAWRDPQGQICSRSLWNGVLQPVEIHGLGRDPVLCQSATGITLAWASGDRINLRPYWGTWGAASYVSTGSGLTAHHPDFYFTPSMTGPDLAWVEGSSVLYSQMSLAGLYGPPEVAATDAVNGVWYGLQLEASDWGTGMRPRIYYLLNGSYALAYRERTGAGVWTTPIPWPMEDWDCFWPVRVAAAGGVPGPNYVLHLGIPRTCPCNAIYFVHETGSGSWSPPDSRTVHAAANDYPQYLGMTSAGDDSAHCFWYQSFYTQALEFAGEAMYYQVYSPWTGWSEPWTFDRTGIYNDVSLGTCTGCARKPEFCWIEKLTEGSRVMALRYNGTGASVDDQAIEPRLTVAPNPFTERVQIEWTVAPARPLRLEVFDVAGRLVRTLTADRSGATRFIWDGRTDAGSPVPPGVYLLKGAGAEQTIRSSLIKIH